ncbi:hypothetical protein KO495_09960 [Colwellia sp. D2M02]|uniref:hypothetical protein n=1 Tax=Colwellia sp. D2M02 TaxID=2841562 RepID=UPI001C0A3B35|nr:hypothetical protein [Colwellia sp. D2M02]MBU2893643.1 hypothetical protein [Colwellia sp. D2M02]
MRSATYRKDRYLHGSSEKKGRIYLMLALFILVLLVLTATFSWNKMSVLNAKVNFHSDTIKLYEQELSVLRTINPYQGSSNELVQNAINHSDIFPGWVTRVYPIPTSKNELNQQSDFGSFVMNGTQFTLASHKSYGIEQPTKSMYRLSGLLPSLIKGRHQIGVEFNFANEVEERSKTQMTKIGSCFAQIIVNHKRVIDKRVSMASRFETTRVVTGEVELGRGLFPIDAVIYCDERSDFNDKDVQISFSFRNPSQQRLTNSSNAIFHIYSPKMVASL